MADRHRRTRLRGDLTRDDDEFDSPYGYRPMHMHSRWGRTVMAFRRVRRDSPVVMECIWVLVIIAIFLGIDIGYLSHTHQADIKGMEQIYRRQMTELESRYKKQIKELESMTIDHKSKFIDDHKEHADEMRAKQKSVLEDMVNNLNGKLKDLVNAADLHWDDHDKFHDDLHGNDATEDPPIKEKMKKGGRAVVNGGL